MDVWIVECLRADFPDGLIESSWSTREAAVRDATDRARRTGTWSCWVTRTTVDDPDAI
jgi:hypothetical protein